MSKPAGWYPDNTDPSALRYWDGQNWTEYTTPAEQSEMPVINDVQPAAQSVSASYGSEANSTLVNDPMAQTGFSGGGSEPKKGFSFGVIALFAIVAIAASIGINALMGKVDRVSPAAQKVYDACSSFDTEFQLMQLSGNSVRLVLTVSQHRLMDQAETEYQQVNSAEDVSAETTPGLYFTFAATDLFSCMAEQTGYTGELENLKNGDRWTGWRYEVTGSKSKGSEDIFYAD